MYKDKNINYFRYQRFKEWSYRKRLTALYQETLIKEKQLV